MDGCDFSILRLFDVLNPHQYFGIWTHTKVVKGSYLPNYVFECDENVTRRNSRMTVRKETTLTWILNVMILPTLKIDTSRVPELLLG